mgnify:CR=1 FL=1
MNDHNLTMKDSALTKRIMRRVYLIAAIRTVIHPLVLKTLIVGAFFWQSTAFVSYKNVLANAPSLLDIESNIRFFSGAIAHTSTITLYLYMGILLMIGWMLFDMARHKTHAWI